MLAKVSGKLPDYFFPELLVSERILVKVYKYFWMII
jgi:hypothetical protein